MVRRRLRAADMFAGAGGMTTGAEDAGIDVVAALNHKELALRTHERNHPKTKHLECDAQQVDPRWYRDVLPDIDILMASPACQGFSMAATKGESEGRGTAKTHEQLRATALTITAALDGLKDRRALPKLLVIENVPSFTQWSHSPDSSDGSQYRWWISGIEGYGYKITEAVLNAADTGVVPQDRKRLFIVGSLGDEVEIPPLDGEHVGFDCCVELDEGDWTAVSDTAGPTQERAKRGRKKLPDDEAFLINLGDSAHSGRPLSRPIGTITTKRHWYLVKRGSRGKDYVRGLLVDEYKRAMGFPDSYLLPEVPTQAIPLLGNAVCPQVATYVLEHAQEAI